MTKHVYLVRHGQKQPLRGDPDLTPTGRQQAAKTGDYFASLDIDHVVTSPLSRTRTTASIIAQKINRTVTADERLKERLNWSNPDQSFDEFIDSWQKGSANRDWQPPKGDSANIAAIRLKQAAFDHASQREKTVLVSHGGVISDFLLHSFSEQLKNFSHPIVGLDLVISECSITHFTITNEQIELIKIGYTAHL